MKLYTREWGSGDKVAVLIHGVISDSRGWWRVGPALAERGYRVIAVDLPGHGSSPRSSSYSPELLASSLLESVPAQPEIAIGHSLGGLTLAVAVERLLPKRAIYSDPGFRVPEGATDMFAQIKTLPREMHEQFHPGWSSEEIDIELLTIADWDETFISTMTMQGKDFTPPVIVPSLVQLADPSFLVSPEFAEELRDKGFEVRVVPGAEHTIHRHLLGDFMSSLDGWI